MSISLLSGVYRIRNVVNGRFYIGSSNNINKRWRSHIGYLKRGKHQSVKFQRAWDKYGQDAFLLEVLEVVEDTRQILIREQYFLDALNPDYNMSLVVGTTFQGRTHSAETRSKMREAAIKRNQDPAYIEKLRIANAGRNNWTGKTLSDEHKAKIGQAHKGKQYSLGMTRSPEACANIKAATQKRSQNPEYRDKLRKASSHPRTWVLSDESRQRMSDSRKGKKGTPMTEAQKLLLAAARRASRLDCGHWRSSPKVNCQRCVDEHRS